MRRSMDLIMLLQESKNGKKLGQDTTLKESLEVSIIHVLPKLKECPGDWKISGFEHLILSFTVKIIILKDLGQ